MSNIADIHAREIFDSRGNPTVQVTVTTEAGAEGECGVPSGASTGEAEAVEKRDGGGRFAGRGVRQAVSAVNDEIAQEVSGMPVSEQKKIDNYLCELDGTEHKHRLGANAILGVSIAAAKAAAQEKRLLLATYINVMADSQQRFPRLFANLINGGMHADSGLVFQEFMVATNSRNILDSTEHIFRTQRRLKKAISEKFAAGSLGVGDEGGFAPPLANTKAALGILHDVIDVDALHIAIDAAAATFIEGGKYNFEGDIYSEQDMAAAYQDIVDNFPVCYLEDPFDEDNYQAHAELKSTIPAAVIGDDLTVTNPKRIKRASKHESVDGVIIKPNQIGTLSETIAAVATARSSNLDCYASHRSGETNDAFIADLAVGLGVEGIKIGALQRGERVAKYNRLLYLYDQK